MAYGTAAVLPSATSEVMAYTVLRQRARVPSERENPPRPRPVALNIAGS